MKAEGCKDKGNREQATGNRQQGRGNGRLARVDRSHPRRGEGVLVKVDADEDN
jgi:hypothetical protein